MAIHQAIATRTYYAQPNSFRMRARRSRASRNLVTGLFDERAHGDYKTAAAFRMARSRSASRRPLPSKGTSWLIRQRKLIVFDRLLARLLVAAPDRWILKGAVALDFRLGDRARSHNGPRSRPTRRTWQAATDDLLSAQAIDLGDFFVFQIERTERSGMGAEVARFVTASERKSTVDALKKSPSTLASPIRLELHPDRCGDLTYFGFRGDLANRGPSASLSNSARCRKAPCLYASLWR